MIVFDNYWDYSEIWKINIFYQIIYDLTKTSQLSNYLPYPNFQIYLLN